MSVHWIPKHSCAVNVWIRTYHAGVIPFIIYGTAGKATEVVKHVAEDVERRFSFQERPSIDIPNRSHEHRPLIRVNGTKTDTTTAEAQRDTMESRPSEMDDILMQLSGGKDQAAALELEMAALSPRSQALPTTRSARDHTPRAEQEQQAWMHVDTRGSRQKYSPHVKEIDEIHVEMDRDSIPPPLTSRVRPRAGDQYESDYDEVSSTSDASAVVGEEGLTPMPMTPSYVHDALRMRNSEEYMPPQLQEPVLSPPAHRKKGESTN